jgi:hypothetical protein
MESAGSSEILVPVYKLHGVTSKETVMWIVWRICPKQELLPGEPHIQGDSGVTATYGAHFWRHFEQKCHINLGPILNIYRVTFVFGFFPKFPF